MKIIDAMEFSLLNTMQREAVQSIQGPLLIFAGAGSGKTRVLVQRIAYLIEEKKVAPWQIFAVTFTNKAAREMKERIEAIIGRRADETWISTFHSAGVRILRQHIEKLHYGKNFVIYDDSEQMTLLKACLSALEINEKIFHPRAIQSRIAAAKNELIEPTEYSTDDFFDEKVAKVYELYDQRLKENNALDFGDLLRLPVKLFRQFPEILKIYTRRLKFLMVDEYQDTNHAQYQLIRLLTQEHDNLCVVGDDDQSIYRWRGADIRNILEFEKDFPHAKIVKLEQNYRSTQNILHAAMEVVKPIQNRHPKTLWTENNEGEKLTLLEAFNEKEEAQFVVQEILKKRDAGLPLNEMAIFYRTNSQSRVFEDELRKANIPYVIYGGMRFYDRMEIKDILAYLWVLINPADNLHLKRIVNVPARGIGKTTIEKLENYSFSKGITLLEALSFATEAGLNAGAAKKVKTFLELLKNLAVLRKTEKLSDFVTSLMERIGYLGQLRDEASLESQSRIENLEEFINVIQDYENSQSDPSLEGFLDQVALVNQTDNEGDVKSSLPLMTLHLAKGLEFKVVFLVGMEEGLLPHSRSTDSQEELDEERRLTYVGMTRSQQKLFLTFAQQRKVFGRDQYNLSSRFLEALPQDIVEKVYSKSLLHHSSLERNSAFGFSRNSSTKEDPFFEENNGETIAVQVSHPYQRGVKVLHPFFGEGTIQSSEGTDKQRKLIIRFSKVGTKKLVAQMANLTIVK